MFGLPTWPHFTCLAWVLLPSNGRQLEIFHGRFDFILRKILPLGCTYPGRQVAVATKPCTAASDILSPQYGAYYMSPFWRPESWSGFYSLEKFFNPALP